MPEQTRTTAQYRLFQEADLEGVLALWRDYSGWGEITEIQFRNWYLNTPHGACLVAVMEEENGQILGQMVMIPAQAIYQGKSLKVLRAVAPILHSAARSLRLTDRDHPALRLYHCLMLEAKKLGYTFAYTFPAYGWQALMKVFPKHGLPAWHISEFDCFSIDLEQSPDQLQEVASQISVQKVNSIQADYDQLWQKALSQMPFQYSICRNKNWLQWRQGGHLVLEMRQKNDLDLMGYLVVDQRTHLLIDALAPGPDALKLVLQAGIWALHAQNGERIPFEGKGLKVMYTDFMAKALEGMTLQKVDFIFTFGCNPFQDWLDPGNMDTRDWYLMPND